MASEDKEIEPTVTSLALILSKLNEIIDTINEIIDKTEVDLPKIEKIKIG